ncbi:MAG: type I-U CRISPR-associated helicase/endonuclease Cas3 [Planctomycetota bacterium]
MTLSPERFDEFFAALYPKLKDPFPWQSRLAADFAAGRWPDCIDLPTASGKTSVIDIAVYTLAAQAALPIEERTLGRRIFFTVNRRVIVDEAFERARNLAQRLLDAEKTDGIVYEVAEALRSINEAGDDLKVSPLGLAQLRGGIARDHSWARSLTQPMVVCSTADQLGSRLLFRGYGVSPGMQPIHAALCGTDSLVLLDEAHVTRAFSQTLQLLPRYQRGHPETPGMRFIQMTATPAGEVTARFELADDDRQHPILSNRQKAAKPATLVKLAKKKPIAGEAAQQAVDRLADDRQAVGIIVNRVQTARDIESALRAKLDKAHPDAEVHLVIGRMRPLDRNELQEKLRTLVGPDRPARLDRPVFVVATQCLEVGADYDFDVLVTECASIDALRQRFGRLNRTGRPIETSAAILTNDATLKGDDPIYGDAIKHTWDWLTSHQNDERQVDFGITPFAELWKDVEEHAELYLTPDAERPLLAPAPDAAVLLPAHLDMLCQTSPAPVPSPDVSYFIHGPQRDMTEVSVCWRADLDADPKHWAEVVRLLPPTSPECMSVPLHVFKQWMGQTYDDIPDTDAPSRVPEESRRSKAGNDTDRPAVLRWRGRSDAAIIHDPSDVQPGDTLVLPTSKRSWSEFGHVPGRTVSDYEPRDRETSEEHANRCTRWDAEADLAEPATRVAKRQLVVRLHPALSERGPWIGLEWDALVRELQTMFDETLTDAHEQAEVRKLLENIRHRRLASHDYPAASPTPDETENDADTNPRVLVFLDRLPIPDPLEHVAATEDDSTDVSNRLGRAVTLTDHTDHVVERLERAAAKLPFGQHHTLGEAARLHDLGKADARFQALLRGAGPYETFGRPLLAKSDGQPRTRAERRILRKRAELPDDFRHEMLTVEILEAHFDDLVQTESDRDLLLHLIAGHHGYARPFAPVVLDEANDETRSLEWAGLGFVADLTVTAEERRRWTPAHRLDSGVAERFWTLTRRHGWWGLATFEAALRLADQQASAAEQDAASAATPHPEPPHA